MTGFVTSNVVCVPVKTLQGGKIGVTHALNRKRGNFLPQDIELLGDLSQQAAIALQGAQIMATTMVFGVTYLANRIWTFSEEQV